MDPYVSLFHQQHQSQNFSHQSYNVIKCIWALPDIYLNILTRALLSTTYLRRQHFREDHADKGCQKFHTSQNLNHAEIGSWNFHENQSQNCIASLLVLLGSSTFPDQPSVSKKVWHVWSFLVPKPFLLSFRRQQFLVTNMGYPMCIYLCRHTLIWKLYL